MSLIYESCLSYTIHVSGKLFANDAEDYFIYSRGGEDWSHIPDFVVGRRAYDNWLVDHAYHDPLVDLVDGTSMW